MSNLYKECKEYREHLHDVHNVPNILNYNEEIFGNWNGIMIKYCLVYAFLIYVSIVYVLLHMYVNAIVSL